MSDAPPDFKALARRYLDLWQEQVAAVAADPALAETVARGVALVTESAAAMAKATQKRGRPETDERTASPNSPIPPADGSPAPAAASDDARLHHDEFTRRIAALEERVAALEAALGGSGGKADRKPGKRRS